MSTSIIVGPGGIHARMTWSPNHERVSDLGFLVLKAWLLSIYHQIEVWKSPQAPCESLKIESYSVTSALPYTDN